MSTLYNELHNKFGLNVFPSFIGLEFGIYRLFTVPNLKCIHAVFAMLWPFQKILVPRCSTGWSVANLFWWVYVVGAVPTGDAPATSQLSIIVFPNTGPIKLYSLKYQMFFVGNIYFSLLAPYMYVLILLIRNSSTNNNNHCYANVTVSETSHYNRAVWNIDSNIINDARNICTGFKMDHHQ